MFIIVGIVVVIASVVVGFTMAGGELALLIQVSEFVTIGGAALGSMLISAPLPLVIKVIKAIPAAITYKHPHKEDYLEMFKAFNDLFLLAQRDGLIAIEKHIESPSESDILSKSLALIKNEFARNFFCDTMKVMLTGGVPPHEIESLMDTEIETYEADNKPIGHTIARVGDAFPGLGIVAAVLGIIVTMGSIDQGAAAVGHHVAAALVGTFLGVLLAYGFVGPIAANLEHKLEHEVKFLETIKACTVAYAKGNPPIVTVEVARRTISIDSKPTFSELENFIRGKS